MDARVDAELVARRAAQCATVALVLLIWMCLISLRTHVSQQAFEVFRPPAQYAALLVSSALPLRLIVAFDDLFIVAYCAASVFFALAVSGGARNVVLGLVCSLALTGGVLDMIENHHILSMLRRAELGFVPSVAELDGRVVASSLKWLFAHAAFAWLGLLLNQRGVPGVLLRVSLCGVQLGLGVATLVVVAAPWAGVLLWARYAALASGFLGMALLARTRSGRSPGNDPSSPKAHLQPDVMV
jgi:hypothetical protein